VVTSAGGHLVRVDFRFPASPVVVEVLGYRYHRAPPQLRRDAERMNAMVADGLRPYQFSYEQVVDAPGEAVAQTRTALAARWRLGPSDPSISNAVPMLDGIEK